MNTTKEFNDNLFKENINRIKELCFAKWIPSEIADEIGMDRHAMISRLRKSNIHFVKRSSLAINNLKLCSNCRIEKNLNEFSKKSKTNASYSSRCKTCRKLYLNSIKASHMLAQIKSRAKQRNLEFNLTIEDIIIPKYCPILDIEINNNIYRYSPSVDRIDPSKGYIKGNVQIISTKANNMKNDATLEEILTFSKYYLNKLENELHK